MMIDRGSPIVMGSLRGLPTVLGSGPFGPSFHDVKAMSALAPMLLFIRRMSRWRRKNRRAEYFLRGKSRRVAVSPPALRLLRVLPHMVRSE